MRHLILPSLLVLLATPALAEETTAWRLCCPTPACPKASRPHCSAASARSIGWAIFGADKVVVIDPSAEAPFRLVDLPSRRVHFAIDPVAVKYAYLFTEDGGLHRLDVLSGQIDKSLKVTEPYSMDGEWSLPRPRIAVAGDVIAVTDPLKGLVHVVDAASFTLDRDIPSPARPTTSSPSAVPAKATEASGAGTSAGPGHSPE